jgi:Na+/proline symporter
VAGAALSLAAILHRIPGGWTAVTAVAGPLGKLQVFDFRWGSAAAFFARDYSFWAGLLGGCFLTTASHGTEQLMVQRLLAAPSERLARRALLTSWIVVAAQFTLFLIVGVCLFVLYRQNGWQPPVVMDRLYPLFVWTYLPAGAAGVVMAAILAAAMSNLSAALNALASTTVIDFLPGRAAGGELGFARGVTLVWGAILFGVAMVARNWGSVFEAGLSIASILYGSLLGVFLLGVLTKRVGQNAAMSGMLAGLAVVLYVKFGTPIAFTWYVLIGTSATFFVGLAGSYVFKENANRGNT